MTTFFPLETRHQLITEKCWWENSTWNLFVVHSSVSHVRSKWFNQCNCYYFPNYTETFFPNLVEKVKVSSMSRFNFDLVLSKRFPDFSFSLHVLLCKICRYWVKFNRCRCVTYKSTNQCSLEKKEKKSDVKNWASVNTEPINLNASSGKHKWFKPNMLVRFHEDM